MGAFNYLAAYAECSNCDFPVYFPEIQFKYGLCWQIKYLIGFEVERATTRTGVVIPNDIGRVIVEGIGTCPDCHQTSEFFLEVIDSLIVGVSLASKQQLRFSVSTTINLVAVGGKVHPIKSGYRCPMLIESEYWDCQLVFAGPWIYPGETRAKVIIQFLSSEDVSERLSENSVFFLTEGSKVVGSGKVDVCYRA